MKTIEVLVEGGKATAAPPLGPQLGPLGVNTGKVVEEINKKTQAFMGMQVPVKITVNEKTKEFAIEVGSPPVSQLIKKELGVERLAGLGKDESGRSAEKVGNLSLEQVIKIAKNKKMLGDLKARVKQVLGTCLSCGVTVENKDPREIIKEINQGKIEIKE
ncbi:MAG: 50S ribosomal protein L11 [Candidatus Aenigmatarchaeota archaeon]